MPRRAFLILLLLFCAPLVMVITGCSETENSNLHKVAVMRNEIVTYVNAVIDSGEKGSQIDVTHLVEKHIKMGDSYETAKEILLKNGFSVREYSTEEARNRKDVKITFRISADSNVEGSWWYRRDIQIFLGSSPESEIVDRVLAKVNLKTI